VATSGVAKKTQVRISDAERDGGIRQLQGALAEGRLDYDEFHERLEMALQARTRLELRDALRDLPAATSSAARKRPWVRRHRMFVAVNSVAWAFYVAQVATGTSPRDLWPLYLTLPWGAFVAAMSLTRAPRPGRVDG
jgi:hypothetical protein